ncbi:non-hydrolyzing UDP-N-acetylglucosamine 2-epimerase [Paenibacillus popilliae]|uniref:UDP-N-acetylglucosamine 2-epimerase n=1 Tax=Paenibacillus popilliae ATCC 14706 TaxID=1212764 RepID=M9LLD9_PAEPP|nr:UDP-N-acetylglucosamine 2-epimerase (non-hydrolyzing) [Paenibacillus popilliae]GAC44145.1 UDP-N-acetylglucosamine 2-epimerase [Paenibacillus popilliae ATCC 14706]
MKVMTIIGTRPEIIRLSLIMQKLDQLAEKHILVHTGQNFLDRLSGVFFRKMGLRTPDYVMNHKGYTLGSQLSTMFGEVERILQQEKPDKVLLLGDTNSALCSIVAERMGIPVIHMEAGNRCFDLEVPEEKNRRVIDAVSSINMPYTMQSKQNLLREGVPSNRIVVIGNPIYEVLSAYSEQITASGVSERLGLKPKSYFLVTTHRSENVDHPLRLKEILNGLNIAAEAFGYRIICSIHPRTKSHIDKMSFLTMHPLVEFYEPFDFFDFVQLEKNSFLALTDSGTVQEECCILHVPTVTVRNSTERPETVDCGSNVVSGLNAGRIVEAVKVMAHMPTNWECPHGYLVADVSSRVVKFVLGGR